MPPRHGLGACLRCISALGVIDAVIQRAVGERWLGVDAGTEMNRDRGRFGHGERAVRDAPSMLFASRGSHD